MKPQLTSFAPLPWPAEVDPDHVRRATSRLLAHVSGQVGTDGAIRGLCDSRVLESALALSLMTRIGAVSPERDRLLGYLQARQHAPQRLDRVLSTLAVQRATGEEAAGDSELVGKLTAGVLGAAPGFISTRRRKMVSAVLSVLGCPLPADVAPAADEQSPTDPLHSWAAVQQAAVALILATAAGVSNQATADALRTLVATDPANTVWEGYVLMHLLTLHALAGVPGQEATVRKGVQTVLRHQRADGGFPFVAEMHNWCTSTGGIALAAAGAPLGLLHRMAGMLVTHQGGAAHATLSRGATLTGGWSMSPGVAQNDVDDTACALEFLQAIDPVAHGGSVRRGVDALLAVQGEDGGFPTYVAGASSEPCMTAAAVCALAPHASTLAAQDRALGFLADSQQADGGWEPGWSSSRLHTLFRARLAAATAGPHDRRTAAMAERIERTVRETQNDDGGWGMQPGDPSDDISTAYGVITLTCGTDEQPIGRALAWLLEHQDADGGFSGPPDMVGPRPFPYKFPVLTDIPVLLAFGHVRSRVTGAAPVLEASVR
ncbi:prenyltransferase/squalene oxidase repeat-containing protein [Streptomyces sp. NK08204]|uniref:prenyltransferase/squalene oxidase repeat-containing protein n=1 Tax=Streptomyces sp. NK08204 TaxID=2873260 RepID=UPI001CEC6D99|nr:prenyltransferase/squalene oxidase repeat-containing protein [Streptomyces sp. NK08204]